MALPGKRSGAMLELERDLLWTDYQPMTVMGIPLGRRVALVRGDAGQLVVFSPLEATPAAMENLTRWGEVVAFVVPSRYHDRYYEGYFERFPRAKFFSSRAVMADHPTWPLTEITPDATELAGIAVEMLEGMPKVQEQVFVHRASRTLIIADAFFNVPLPDATMTRMLMSAADIGGAPPRPSRLFRSGIRDRTALARSLQRVLAYDFARIVPGHGEVVPADGKRVLQEAFRDVLAAG